MASKANVHREFDKRQMAKPCCNLRFPESRKFSEFPPDALAGNPIWSMLAMSQSSILMRECFVGRLYFFLPKRLLELLNEEIGLDTLASTNWNRDWQLAADPRRRWNEVGAIDGLPLTYGYLETPAPSSHFTAEQAAEIGTTPEALAKILAIAAHRLDLFQTPAMGYCGWLLTNKQFLQEHDDLLTKWAVQIRKVGLPIIAQSGTDFRVWGAGLPAQEVPDVMAIEFKKLFARWRLSGLKAPYLPEPLVPQVPAPIPERNPPPPELNSIKELPQITGTTFFLPDTFPIPARDELRRMLEDSLRGTETSHLADWHKIVGAENRSKRSIERFARLFSLQHYYAVLQSRYGKRLYRQSGKVEHAFAQYFLGDDPGMVDTIHRDLVFIRSRLGKDWFSAPTIPRHEANAKHV